MLFINNWLQLIKATKALFISLLVLTSILMQGCVTPQDKQKSTKKELHHLGKEIVDMVAIDDKQQTPPANNSLTPAAVPIKNLYLEQQVSSKVSAESAANFQAALRLMRAKKWYKAQQLLDKIIAQQPELSGSYVNKALIALHQKHIALANEQLTKALLANPNNPYAYNLQGQIARTLGNFSQAEKNYRQALTIWPQYTQAQLNMAILLELYRGRLLDSMKYYQAYLKIKPQDKQAQRWLAGLELKIKRAGLTAVNANDKTINKASRQ